MHDFGMSDSFSQPVETYGMGAPNIEGNSPTMMWGQHHRIKGQAFFRNHRQGHEEMMGIGIPVATSVSLGDWDGKPPYLQMTIGAIAGYFLGGTVGIPKTLASGLGLALGFYIATKS